MYAELKRENSLAGGCLEKKSDFRLLKVANKRIIFFKYSLFQNVKELFKSNQKRCANPLLYLNVKSENHLAPACLGKNKVFVG